MHQPEPRHPLSKFRPGQGHTTVTRLLAFSATIPPAGVGFKPATYRYQAISTPYPLMGERAAGLVREPCACASQQKINGSILATGRFEPNPSFGPARKLENRTKLHHASLGLILATARHPGLHCGQ